MDRKVLVVGCGQTLVPKHIVNAIAHTRECEVICDDSLHELSLSERPLLDGVSQPANRKMRRAMKHERLFKAL